MRTKPLNLGGGVLCFWQVLAGELEVDPGWTHPSQPSLSLIWVGSCWEFEGC